MEKDPKPSWIGVELDGTLAYYNGWAGAKIIGDPIPSMVTKVKDLLEQGFNVKIFTWRASLDIAEEIAIPYIKAWCREHIGQELEVTNIKDIKMICLYDAQAIPVKFNKGPMKL